MYHQLNSISIFRLFTKLVLDEVKTHKTRNKNAYIEVE